MAVEIKANWIDRAMIKLSPERGLKRLRARVAAELMMRHYEAGAGGRRTSGWRRSSADANATQGPYLQIVRERARDLVRNNPNAESALSTIADQCVGFGIVAKAFDGKGNADDAFQAEWKRWTDSTDCDADGINDYYGLQKLVMRSLVESGEVLVRRRLRLPQDGFRIPMQLQVLEADFLDQSKDSLGVLPGGRRIIQGVEYDVIGRRIAYWLFPEHPGSVFGTIQSVRVPAENVRHLFRPMRPGQVRGMSWFAPTLLRFKDFDEYEDAQLMKQKIAACLAVLTTDPDGSGVPVGEIKAENENDSPQIDSLEPGAILNLAPGRSIEVVQPPSVREYADYAKVSLRAIATGIGIPYEDLTGDYTDMPFSAARMSFIRHWRRVEDWRWRLMIPQFCTPSFAWFTQVAAVFGIGDGKTTATWTPPAAPMIDPVNEGLAYMRNIRAGLMSLSEALRERGYDPEVVLDEIASDNKLLDKLGIILDSDPRYMTQAGQLQGDKAAAATPAASSSDPAAARMLTALLEEVASRIASRQAQVDPMETAAARLRLAGGRS